MLAVSFIRCLFLLREFCAAGVSTQALTFAVKLPAIEKWDLRSQPSISSRLSEAGSFWMQEQFRSYSQREEKDMSEFKEDWASVETAVDPLSAVFN